MLGAGRNLEYSDSFAMPIDLYDNVAKALDDHGLKYSCIAANHTPLQALTSTVCGQYSIVFLAWRTRHMNEDMRMFGYDMCRRGKTADARDPVVLDTLAGLVERAIIPPISTRTPSRHTRQTCIHRHGLFKAASK